MRSLSTTAAAWTLAATGLAVLSLAAPRALAGEEEPVQARDEATGGVAWVEGFEPGREKAEHTGRLMLVYVHRTSPP